MRILYVEDNEDIRESFAAALRLGRHDVVTAESGQAALRMLTTGLNPDVILLDLNLPMMDGFGFRRRQLANPAIAEIPVIACTAYDRMRGESEELGMTFIQKPVLPEDLLAIVSSLEPKEET